MSKKAMSARIFRVVAASLGLLANGIGMAAAPPPDQSLFFTEGLAAPYFTGARFAQLVRLCVSRFEQDCRDDNRYQDLRSLNPGIFDRVTVLGKARKQPLRVESWTEFANEVVRTKQQFMRELLEYEKSLVPKLAAVFDLCPDENSRRDVIALEALRVANFGRFWLLPAKEYEHTLAELDAAQRRHLSRLRLTWSKSDCVQARRIAIDILGVMSHKVRPLLKDDWASQTQNERLGEGIAAVWYLGMRAEAAVRPEAFTEALESGPK